MHDQDGPVGRSTARVFAPRLVGGDQGTPGQHPSQGPAQSPTQHIEINDPEVRKIADSLADLFLGPAAQSHGSTRAPSRSAAESLRAGDRAGGDTLGTARGSHGPRESTPAARPTASLPRIEMLVLGHLPVLAGAWLTQYAAQAAQALGQPVALARLEPGGLSIDVFGLPSGVASKRHDSLEDALKSAQHMVGAWLLRVDELAEAGVAESPAIASITLLSGVSESSIVAAYRALKSIAQRAAGRAGSQDRDEPADLRIALLGASEQRAREASARIRKAAATFLGRPVGVVVCAEKMGLTGMRSLYRGRYEGDPASLLTLIQNRANSTEPLGRRSPARELDSAAPMIEPSGLSQPSSRSTPTPASELEPEGETSPTRDGPRMLVSPLDHSAVSPARVPERPHPEATADEDDWLLEPAPERAHTRPKADAALDRSAMDRATTTDRALGASGVAARADSAAAPGSFAALLALSTVPLACPTSPGVELAVDSAGGLHAIVLDEMSVGSMAADPGTVPARAGVAALLSAEAWARANMALIARAMPFVRGGEVSLHLLTRVPASARDLLETRVRVHLLVRAGSIDVCVALN